MQNTNLSFNGFSFDDFHNSNLSFDPNYAFFTVGRFVYPELIERLAQLKIVAESLDQRFASLIDEYLRNTRRGDKINYIRAWNVVDENFNDVQNPQAYQAFWVYPPILKDFCNKYPKSTRNFRKTIDSIFYASNNLLADIVNMAKSDLNQKDIENITLSI